MSPPDAEVTVPRRLLRVIREQIRALWQPETVPSGKIAGRPRDCGGGLFALAARSLGEARPARITAQRRPDAAL